MKDLTPAAISGVWQRMPLSTGRAGWRWLVPALALFAVVAGGDTGELVRDTLAEAYLQVSVFVAATLMIFYAVEQVFAVDLSTRLSQARRSQVPIAALLGMLPGCGGAIVVVTQFVNGRIGFGALVAVLVATMGDAAFLLIAAQPQTAGVVLGISLVVAVICGWAVDAIHGRAFMQPAPGERAKSQERIERVGRAGHPLLDRSWLLVWAIGLPFAIAIALQADPNTWFGPWASDQPATWLGCIGALLAMGMWAARIGEVGASHGGLSGDESTRLGAPRGPMGWARRARTDTNFVTVWVVAAFLLFELGVSFSGVDPATWIAVAGPLMPLVGLLVGFIPGCGPQILLTTLYLNGAVPMSALLANAISNDGDALFPAIALAPKAAVLATLYSAIPALVVGYAAYTLGY